MSPLPPEVWVWGRWVSPASWAVAFFVWRNAPIAANQSHRGTLLTCTRGFPVCTGDGDSSGHHWGDLGAMRGDPSTNKIHTKYCVLYRLGYYVLTRLLWLNPRPLTLYSPQNGHRKYGGAQMYSFYKINFIDLTAVCYKVACSLTGLLHWLTLHNCWSLMTTG